jgi:hypothetical protein
MNNIGHLSRCIQLEVALLCRPKGFPHEQSWLVSGRLVAPRRSLLQVRGALDCHLAVDRCRRADPFRRCRQRGLQRMEPTLLRHFPEQGRTGLLARDDQFLVDRRPYHRVFHCPRTGESLLAPALAAVAHQAISRALARQPRLLPHRAGAQNRQRRPAHLRGSPPARPLHHDARGGRNRRGGDAHLVPVHPVAALGLAVAGLHRYRRQRAGLHGVGGAGLCLRRYLARQHGRPPADPAQLRPAGARGRFPLRPGARARERRRTWWRATRRYS